MLIKYAAKSVGPVCKRLAALQPNIISIEHDDTISRHDDVLVRWGSRRSDHTGIIEINSAEAIATARNKLISREILAELAPLTWTKLQDIQLPCVIRPKFHRAASKFFVCKTLAETQQAIKKCHKGWYASELINKQSEYRVFILQGYIICISQRFPANEGDIAWNLAVGGRLINLNRKEWPVDIIKVSLEAARRLGLDWTAIDVCKDVAGKVYIFEANTAPGLRNSYTMKQIAKAFASVKEVIAPPKRITTWQHALHPALQ